MSENPAVLLCISALSDPPAPSTIATCAECGSPIWVSDVGVQDLAVMKIRCLCIPCGLTHLSGSDAQVCMTENQRDYLDDRIGHERTAAFVEEFGITVEPTGNPGNQP